MGKTKGNSSKFSSPRTSSLRANSILFTSKPELSVVEEHEDFDDVIAGGSNETTGSDLKSLGKLPRRLSRSSGGLFTDSEMDSWRRRHFSKGNSNDSDNLAESDVDRPNSGARTQSRFGTNYQQRITLLRSCKTLTRFLYHYVFPMTL